MISALSHSALTGIQRGLQQTTSAASDIATANGDFEPADFAKSMVDMKLAQRQIEASARALQVEDQLRGSLLDIRV